MKLLLQVIRSDSSHGTGDRQLINGDLQLLCGFEINEKLPKSYYGEPMCTVTADNIQNSLVIDILPTDTISISNYAPKNASHFKVVPMVASIDLVKDTFNVVRATDTSSYPITDEKLHPYRHVVPALYGKSILHIAAVAVEYYNEKRDALSGVRSTTRDSLRIVGAYV